MSDGSADTLVIRREENQLKNLIIFGTMQGYYLCNRESPSGKATDSESVIRRFESYLPSQFFVVPFFSLTF